MTDVVHPDLIELAPPKELGRLGRKIWHVRYRYGRLAPEWIATFERALVAARDCLTIVEEVKQLAPGLGQEFGEALMMALIEGKVSGSWPKVHRELSAAWPRVYDFARQLLPREDEP
jgi:hypothetical protein